MSAGKVNYVWRMVVSFGEVVSWYLHLEGYQLSRFYTMAIQGYSLARSVVWWPGLDAELEAKVKSCEACQVNSRSSSNWEWPKKPCFAFMWTFVALFWVKSFLSWWMLTPYGWRLLLFPPHSPSRPYECSDKYFHVKVSQRCWCLTKAQPSPVLRSKLLFNVMDSDT